MKKLALTLGTAAGMLAGATTAWAQDDFGSKADRRFYLSPMATYSLYDSTRSFDDEIGYHLAFGKIFGRGANLELHGSFAEPSAADAGGAAGELLSYGVTALLFQSRDTFPLYLILGISKGTAESPDAAGKADSDQFDIGLGYMLGLGNWPWVGTGPALRVEARYRLDKYAESEAGEYDSLFGAGTDRSYHDGVFGLGLYLPLGADPNRQEEPEEPARVSARIVVPAIDSDGDQIPDDMDACPGTPPGAAIDVRGCERDSDKDGVPNSKDACPNTPSGALVGPNGCPPDDDNDGVSNTQDQCPATPAGLAVLADGCALKGDCRIPSAGQRIDASGCVVGSVILKGVSFASGSAELTPTAIAVLNDAAAALRAASQLRIEIGGHTDSQGSAASNQQLSTRRAEAVKQYLKAQGVGSSVLLTRGYGASAPVVANDSAEGREMNRRVELKVLD